MNSLPVSEYNRNFGWLHGDRYSRSPPIEHFAPGRTNIPYRHTLLYNSVSSLLNHKAVAKQYLKLNPYLDRTGLRNEKKTDYELSLSTYQDSFRKHAKYPSVQDYIQIAENVADNYFPESVKYYYQPDEGNDRRESICGNSELLKSAKVRIREPTSENDLLESTEMKKSLDHRMPPKITDLGACHYRNDISPECMPRYLQSDEEIVEEVNRTAKRILQGYPDNEEEDTLSKGQKRYINFLEF